MSTPDLTLERAKQWAREHDIKVSDRATIDEVLKLVQERSMCEAARLLSYRYRMLLETMELAMTNFKGNPH